jgi:hypothetical protein
VCITGDVVGCGINFVRDEVFFTRNGRLVGAPTVQTLSRPRHLVARAGSVKRRGAGPVFATVSMHSTGECVRPVFDGPFRFDVAAMRKACPCSWFLSRFLCS